MHNTKKYLHTCTFNSGLICASIALFITIVLFYSRIKSFPRNLCSRSSKNSSSVSKLKTRSSKLGSRTSKIKSRNSSLETRFLILKNFEDRESSFELRLSTYIWAVLYVLGCSASKGELQELLWHLLGCWAKNVCVSCWLSGKKARN